MKPVNRLAAKGMNYDDEQFIGLQGLSPLPYHKFRKMAKSKNYRERTPGFTHSQRMDLLSVELGAKNFMQYRATMLHLGLWKEHQGIQRLDIAQEKPAHPVGD